MAMWLFRRRSRKRRSRPGSQAGEVESFPRRQTVPAAATNLASSPIPIPSASKSKRSDLVGPDSFPRTYSFESGRNDEMGVRRKRSLKKEAAPHAGSSIPGGLSPATHLRVTGAHGTDGEKNMRQPPGGTLSEHHQLSSSFGHVPKLHPSKRDSGHLMSRKLSKRRKDSHDREREAELKALRDSQTGPIRPATDAWISGRPVKRESRRVRSGLSFAKNPWEREQHPSDVSLPIPESIHSSLSSDSDQVSYRVSALALLAPKPTLRYSVSPRCVPNQSTDSAPAGRGPPRRAFSAQIPESTLKAHKRINDLADDLNASDLRELMERDKRRRQRKYQREQEKVEKKLARRAERERLAVANGAEPSTNLERGVLGRESPDHGHNRISAVVTSSRQRSNESSPKAREQRSEFDEAVEPRLKNLPRPVQTFHRVDSMPVEPPTPTKEVQEPTLPLSREQSPKIKGFLRSKKPRSKSPPSEPTQSESSVPPRKMSPSSFRGSMSWATTIFRWGNRNKRAPGPSSFSNTSRDSMSTTQPLPPSAPAMNVTFIPPAASGAASTIPKRTRSRFREDLPELPLSPPDSRVQSPEQEPLPATPALRTSAMPTATAPINIPGKRYDTPNSMVGDAKETSPEPQMSMSLASIDSEGSWLSGGRKRSVRMSSQIRRRAHASTEFAHADQAHMDDEAAGIADDEYLNRITQRTSTADSWAARRQSTGEPMPSSDEEDAARWGAVARQPSVVRPKTVDRVKSREVLLNTTVGVANEDNSSDNSPVSPSEEVGTLQRATSVNLGKGHAKRISAGSARLLDISPRSSMEVKRNSSGLRFSESAPKSDEPR